MKSLEVIRTEQKETVVPGITHIYFVAEQRDNIEVLKKLVTAIKLERAIVFINKSEELQLTMAELQYHHLKASDIFGSVSKEERRKALENLRRGSINILVALDLTTRGFDIKGVTHIINLDLQNGRSG